jgi:multidrug efflux pump subunit AcrA (membrane-fusion protein)
MDEQRQGDPEQPDVKTNARGSSHVQIIIAAGVVVILLLGGVLVWHAESKTNKVADAASPKPVSVLAAKGEPYRAVHTYVGTLRPWIDAKVGPQFISAYVETVLVRPGAVVKRGEVLATLDCRNATAQTAAISSMAKAIAARRPSRTKRRARRDCSTADSSPPTSPSRSPQGARPRPASSPHSKPICRRARST